MVQFGDREVGNGARCFVTFEVGPTHTGLDSAKRLIRHAADAKADAVKFQMLDPASSHGRPPRFFLLLYSRRSRNWRN